MRRGSSDGTRSVRADSSAPLDRIIWRSPSMAAVLRDIEKIAPVDVSVLLLGESGTGKELLAQAVHELSPRAKGPFVAINCPAIPETLLESELFGHEKGSFTGAVQQTLGKIESANGGTLFLDEIGDIPQSMQVKLLRFLQNQVIERVGGGRPRKVDVRIVYATNQDLEHQIAEGRFREDLFYRINQVAVRVPPVRERGGDAVLLAHHFLKRFAGEFGREPRGFSSEALQMIEAYRWPGNVRDIENRVRRAVIMGCGSVITAADLDLAEPEFSDNLIDLRQARQRAEAEVLRHALAQTGSNLSQAAKLLGISRPTLYSLLRQHRVGTLGLRREQLSVGVTDRPSWRDGIDAAE
jgi:two-component system NtrC family response regulator